VQKSQAARRRKPKLALVLSGGAISGGAFKIGGLIALDTLFSNLSVCDFQMYMGISAGSFLAAPLAARAREENWLDVAPTVPHAAVAPFLRGLDLFCLPAHVLPDHEEHDAHALMEAMACGIACIGTRSGIIPELLDGKTGLLVPPADPPALAEAIAACAFP
ncbi:MAG: glycosyltransferase, partial [Rhodospirillaceae bacterium]|nr:glycosyltransferase [Rhodospirillaceae bacterium]